MRAALSLCLLTASVASCHRTLKAEPDAAELNLRPLIGILSQPGGPSPNSSFSYIAASYVKFVEASGGRAVPIQYDLTKAGVKKIFDNINGVLIPGGGAQLSPHHQFYDTAAYLVNLTTAANDAGDYFPLHGTCLGMEVLSVILSKPLNTSILTIFDSEDNASELILTSKANGSRFFNSFPPEVLQNLQTQPLAMENHAFGLSYETYTANSGLQEFFAVTSLSLDRQGAPYVSTIEARSYPVTATQWHPEKNAFEWAAGLHIPHTPEAVEVTHAVSNFLINEARRNKHSPGSRKKEIELLINRFPVAFTGQARSEGIETGFDECYFLPTRQKAVLEVS